MPKGVPGEKHYKTHLLWVDVREMRRLRKEERTNYRKLGDIFHINPDTARDICWYVTWKDDPEDSAIPLAGSYGHRNRE